jgi:hypothetical protein
MPFDGLLAASGGEPAAVAGDRKIKVVIIAARGPALSAGCDLQEIRATPTSES